MDTPWRERDYLKSTDVMEILDVSRPTAIAIMHELPHFKFGKNCIRISRPAFEKYLKDNERANAR